MAEAPALDLDRGLATLGLEAFRPGQREAIETLLERRRLLLVAPTGGGKSLVYQLPALIERGTTLVVSPLVSLMHDQVAALTARGVNATYLAATLTGEELRRRLAEIGRGGHKLVYVAPERLGFTGFQSLLERLECPLVAIDEAHCISEWGHDFRPDYMQIGQLLRRLPDARVLACTATATPVVRDEIIVRLGLPADTQQLVHGFARPNLRLRTAEARGVRERRARVDAMLAEALGKPGAGAGAALVYAPTRRAAEAEAERLAGRGWKAAAYHAGLPGRERERVQQAFRDGVLELVAATNAFGMGIDRGDVRAVVHLGPPGSIEAYYQEVGRAGRDGAPAFGLMLFAAEDFPLRRRLLEMPTEDRAPDPVVVEHKWGLFLELMRWAESGSCRHDGILAYFGTDDALLGCGRCDVCESLEARDESGDEETTLLVRKALSGAARVHDRLGLDAAAKLLVGDDDPRLERHGLRFTTTFGILHQHPIDWVRALLRRCVTAGWIGFSGGDWPVLRLLPEGREVMRGERPARLLLPSRERSQPGRTCAPGTARAARASADLDAPARALFDALRARRLELARDAGIPAYHVASDRTLRDLCALRPRTRAELLGVHGIGEAKAERWGEALIGVVQAHAG